MMECPLTDREREVVEAFKANHRLSALDREEDDVLVPADNTLALAHADGEYGDYDHVFERAATKPDTITETTKDETPVIRIQSGEVNHWYDQQTVNRALSLFELSELSRENLRIDASYSGYFPMVVTDPDSQLLAMVAPHYDE